MNDDVVFWTWISESTLGMVTEREVLHWKVMDGQAAPTKVSLASALRRARAVLTL
jgi:clathrin heavy chain